MKKLICILFCLIVMTGCGNKETPPNPENPNNPNNPGEPNNPDNPIDPATNVSLTCDMASDEDGVKVEINSVSVFKEDKTTILTSKMETKISVNEEMEQSYRTMADEMIKQYDSYKNLKGVTLSIDDNNKNQIIIKVEIDYTKIDENAKKILELEDANNSYDKVKEQYDSLGATCK